MTFPYQVLQVPGEAALAKLTELGSANAGFPIIVGDDEKLQRLEESFAANADQDIEQLIATASAIDPANWFIERQASDPEYYDIDEDDWPEEVSGSGHGLTSHRDILTGKHLAVVNIAMIPAPEAWMVPCYLRIGGWNECPNPEEHAALFRYWGEKYGAVVACVSDDVIEMTVARPPSTREAALELAKEQFLYCSDIVHQGTETVEALAAGLLGARVWFFWWD